MIVFCRIRSDFKPDLDKKLAQKDLLDTDITSERKPTKLFGQQPVKTRQILLHKMAF